MRIHLAAIDGPFMDTMPAHLRRLAKLSGRHELCRSAADADVILFSQANMLATDWKLNSIRHNPLTSQYRSKCFIYDERDLPWCSMPGLYASLDVKISNEYQEVVPYAWLEDRSLLALRECSQDLLFSFVGSRTHPIREEILRIDHPRGLVADTTGFMYYRTNDPGFERDRAAYLASLGRSQFVLCPRGHGLATVRFYEALAAGRVPVVISDRWRPPGGVDWSNSYLQWPERRHVNELPAFLEGAESEFAARAATCAHIHDEYFADARRFDYMLERLALVVARTEAFPARGVRDRQFVRACIREARGNVARAWTTLKRSHS